MSTVDDCTQALVAAMREELRAKEALHAARNGLDVLETRVASAGKDVIAAKRALDQALQAVARGDA